MRFSRWDKVDTATRFWAKVEKRGPDECWPFTGSNHERGYGMFSKPVDWEGPKMLQAHRVAFVLSGGTLTPEEEVLHSCDNPPCCNPGHLSKGTHADNMADMATKDRSVSPTTKLTETEVLSARAERLSGATVRSLAAKHGISESNMSRVLNGQRWKKVKG